MCKKKTNLCALGQRTNSCVHICLLYVLYLVISVLSHICIWSYLYFVISVFSHICILYCILVKICVHQAGVQTHMFTSLLSGSLITSFAPALKMPSSDIFSSLKLSTFLTACIVSQVTNISFKLVKSAPHKLEILIQIQIRKDTNTNTKKLLKTVQ